MQWSRRLPRIAFTNTTDANAASSSAIDIPGDANDIPGDANDKYGGFNDADKVHNSSDNNAIDQLWNRHNDEDYHVNAGGDNHASGNSVDPS